MPVEVRNGHVQFRLRLVDGDAEVKSLMVTAAIPPEGAVVSHDAQDWQVSKPAWVLEGKKLFQVVTMSLKKPVKRPTRRSGPITAQYL